ncbi:hypothetical protein Salat_2353200 [Sesamum alatum]|uniref:Uncharacterized protein n=1 Tax=Sesamum alatum TaxID=300844 RepID=A0AAE2CEQ7_9LAMI|nr:hypothetical protein Salat_2353200 [Sesamum alatum]
MAVLAEKLRRLKQRLKHWNKTIFGDLFQNLTQAEETVKQAERRYDADPSDENLYAMNEGTGLLQHSLSVEEDFWRQKAACRWTLDGDRNTRYFHSLVKKGARSEYYFFYLP